MTIFVKNGGFCIIFNFDYFIQIIIEMSIISKLYVKPTKEWQIMPNKKPFIENETYLFLLVCYFHMFDTK